MKKEAIDDKSYLLTKSQDGERWPNSIAGWQKLCGDNREVESLDFTESHRIDDKCMVVFE